MADDADLAAQHLERQETDFLKRLRETRDASANTHSSRQRTQCVDCGVALPNTPNEGRCSDCQDDIDRIRANRRGRV